MDTKKNEECAFQSTFIKKLFEKLSFYEISYCVVKNYVVLQNRNISKDIDILISHKKLSRSLVALKEVAIECDVNLIFVNNFQYAKCFTLFKIVNNICMSVKIDLIFNFEIRGARLLTCEEMLNKKQVYDYFFIADDVHDAIVSWLKPLITGGVIKDQYRMKIISTANSKKNEFRKCITLILGRRLSRILMSYILNDRLDQTIKFTKEIRWTAWMRCFMCEPHIVLKNLFIHIYFEIKRRCVPIRQNIAIIGPDGVGKSTVIECLKMRIANVLKWDMAKIKIFHFRPCILPNIKKLQIWQRGVIMAEDFSKPHRAKPSNAFFSLLRLLYYTSDYILGYYCRLHWLFGKHYVLLFDRYYYDFIVDPARSRIKLPKAIPMLLMKLIPKPTLTVLLENDVDTILKRKQELPASEIARQIVEYRSLVELLPNAIGVDGRRSIDSTVEEIVAEYLKKITIPIGRLQECY